MSYPLCLQLNHDLHTHLAETKMIVGNGLIARAFHTYREHPNVMIFAAGVSNSTETNPTAFKREEDLLKRSAGREAMLLYFSTCAIDSVGPRTPYLRHKLEMEAQVTRIPSGHVIRLPQVVGIGGNPLNLVNFLFRHIRDGLRFPLFLNTRRNLIDANDVFAIVDELFRRGWRDRVLRVASPDDTIGEDIVRYLEAITGRAAVFDPIQRGDLQRVDVSAVESLIPAYRDRFPPSYVRDLIHRNFRCP